MTRLYSMTITTVSVISSTIIPFPYFTPLSLL